MNDLDYTIAHAEGLSSLQIERLRDGRTKVTTATGRDVAVFEDARTARMMAEIVERAIKDALDLTPPTDPY